MTEDRSTAMFNPFKKDKPDAPAGDTPPERAEAQHTADGGEPLGAGPSHADRAASELDALREQVAAMTEQLAVAKDERARALADYANFQRRSALNERDAREMGVRGVLGSVMPVIDHFDMALSQAAMGQAAPSQPSQGHAAATQQEAASGGILQGVAMIRDELVRAMALHGAVAIKPAKGDAFDPQRHKAIAHVPAPGVLAGAVVTLTRAGFMIGERVVRPAEVVIAAEVAGPVSAVEPGASGSTGASDSTQGQE